MFVFTSSLKHSSKQYLCHQHDHLYLNNDLLSHLGLHLPLLSFLRLYTNLSRVGRRCRKHRRSYSPLNRRHLCSRHLRSCLAKDVIWFLVRHPNPRSNLKFVKYVDLSALSSTTDRAVLVAMGNNGHPTISMTPVHTSPPGSSYELQHLSGRYASIYLQAHVGKAASLMT